MTAGSNHEDSHEVRLTADSYQQDYPEIYGDIVVWSEEKDGHMSIVVYNLQTKERFPIEMTSGNQMFPKIYGDIVVWRDWRNGNWDIYGYNLKTKEEFPIATGPYDQNTPAIYEDIVVWVDNNGISGINLRTKEEFKVTQYYSLAMFPEIYGNYVVWREESSSEILGFNLETKETIKIGKTAGFAGDWVGFPAIYGDTVVWTEKSFREAGIRAYNLKTGEKFWIKKSKDVGSPAIYGDYVVWVDYRRNGNSDIYGYNLKAEEESRITYSPVNQHSPAIYGDYVVWVNTEYGDHGVSYHIYGCNLSAIPPPPAPAHSQLTPRENGYIIVAIILLTGGIVLVLEMKRSTNEKK